MPFFSDNHSTGLGIHCAQIQSYRARRQSSNARSLHLRPQGLVSAFLLHSSGSHLPRHRSRVHSRCIQNLNNHLLFLFFLNCSPKFFLLFYKKFTRKANLSKTKASKFNESGQLLSFYLLSTAWACYIFNNVSGGGV